MDLTPHFSGDKTLVSSVMLMPGDPMRSKYIAEVFLQDAVMFNNVRGVNGYTGTYHGKRVSVSASGMGMPSIGVYSYEFFNFFGVEKVIRVGSAGAVAEGVGLRDIVIAQGACTDSAYANQFRLHGTYAPIADFDLLDRAAAIAKEKKLNFHVGNILSSDYFYDDAQSLSEWRKMGVLAVEMETAALYMNAARAGKKALSLLTVSDVTATGEKLSAHERQVSFNDMIELALKVAVE